MAELAALSLACNVFQVISFAHEVYNLSKEIRVAGTADLPALDHATQLAELSTTLECKYSAYTPVTKQQQALKSHAQNCLEISKKVQRDLTFKEKDGLLRNTLRAWLRRSSTERHKAELLACEQSLQTQILGDFWIQNQAMLLEQQHIFNELDNPLQLFIQNIAAGQTQLQELFQREAAATRTHLTLEGARTRDHMTQEFRAQERNSRFAKLLASLEFSGMNERKNQRSIDAHEDTFQWIFEDSDKCHWGNFRSFLTSQQENGYWITGKPGSGKSTLMKFLVYNPHTIEYLKEWSPKPLIISYFFWARGSPMQRNTKGLLSSLVYQILEDQPRVLDSLADLNVWNKTCINDWSEQELEQLLFPCLKNSQQAICLFLDGLDEIDKQEDPFDLLELVNGIRACANTKICLASRSEQPYGNEFRNLPRMRMEDLTRSDISKYVNKELRKYGFGLQSDEETNLEALVKLIVYKAEGVFLWVYLVLKSLRRGKVRCDDWDKLEARIKKTPSDLYKLYQEMWERLGDDIVLYQQDAAFYFQSVIDEEDIFYYHQSPSIGWLAFVKSMHPQRVIQDHLSLPSLDELNTECEKMRQHIVDYSAGLLEVTDSRLDDFSLDSLDTSLAESGWIRFQVLNCETPHDSITALKHLSQLHTFNAYDSQTVQFIHRSAADFLLDTKEGRDILAHGQVTGGERQLNLGEYMIYKNLIGTDEDSLRLYNLLLEASDYEYISENQIDHILRFAEKAFYRQLEDLEFIRGRELSFTTQSLSEIARSTVGQFIQTTAWLGYLAGIRNYVDHVKSRGFELTHDFKTFILFNLMNTDQVRSDPRPRRPRKWRACDHDMVSWLLKVGADPNEFRNRWYLQPSYPNMSAFEAFVFDVPSYVKNANGFPDDVSLKNTLMEFMEYNPDLGKKVYGQSTLTVRSGLNSHGVKIETYWEVIMAEVAQMAKSTIEQLGSETQAILQGSSLEKAHFNPPLAKLVLVRAGYYYLTERLENPVTVDLEVIHSDNNRGILSISSDVYDSIMSAKVNGERLGEEQAQTWLRSKGYEAWDKREYPDPVHGFSEYYDTPKGRNEGQD